PPRPRCDRWPRALAGSAKAWPHRSPGLRQLLRPREPGCEFWERNTCRSLIAEQLARTRLIEPSEGVLFKLEGDEQHASKVTVQYGRAGRLPLRCSAGSSPATRSSMSAFATKDRVRLQ